MDSDKDDSSASQSNDIDGEIPKCSTCRKRLGRKNCLQQACIQCCTDPTCEPHREAREVLKKKESILDGTDWITRTAAQKRARKVSRGVFHESNIEYFGDTVVIWNLREYMKVPKWREDAIRKSRRQEEMQEFSRKRRGDDANSGDGPGEKKRRKKRFKAICDELYEKSLSK